MISRRGLLKESRLYVILDRDIPGANIYDVARQAGKAGADIMQLRGKHSSQSKLFKTALALKKITKRARIPFIVNDDPALAVAVGADGLHIGRGDIDIGLARRLLGRDKLIGVSAKSYKQALAAKKAGADYLGIGPVFHTPIKRWLRPRGFGLLGKVRRLNIPAFAIGGINMNNISKVTAKGFKRIAVIRAVSAAKNPYLACKRLKVALARSI